MSANLKGPFYISSLKVKKKKCYRATSCFVNAHTISFQRVKNGTRYATAPKRRFRILDPTKTLKEELGTKRPSALAAASSWVHSVVMLVNKPTDRENLDLNPGVVLNEGLSHPR